MTAGGKGSAPSEANAEASPVAAASMENSPAGSTKHKKNRLCAFFKKTWLAVKNTGSRGTKVEPLQPVSDSSDLQCGPSGLKPAAHCYLDDPQPGPFVLQTTTLQDQPSVTAMNCDEEPADPGPENQTNIKKKKRICVFFRRMWRAVKHTSTHRRKHNKVSPFCPQPNTDSADHRSDPNMSGLASASQYSALLLPGPSTPEPIAPKFPDQTCFRVARSTNPTLTPFNELYEVGEKIGEGSFGAVYEGMSKSLRKQVAIKFIPKCKTERYIEIPGCSESLFAEVALNLLLNQPPLSPYIVHMLEWFEEEHRFILILEYPQPCKDLFRYMVYNMKQANESLICSLIYQAVLGAKHCLDRGIFHRDIKLNNFLINTETNRVKLIDFGCSDLIKNSGCLGNFKGVCSPEYYNDLKYEAEATTVRSLGMMMHHMARKCQPINTLEDTGRGNLSFKAIVSPELQDLLNRCMTPRQRATIEEILHHEWFQQGQMSGVAQDQVV